MLSRRRFLAGSAVALAASAQSLTDCRSLAAAESAACQTRQDEFWVIDTHGAACDSTCSFNAQVQRCTGGSGWKAATLTDFYAACSDGLPTLLFVHGNRSDRGWAMKNGCIIYSSLMACDAPATPVRYVIYAWPADQIRGPVRDARYKTLVSNSETWRCAQFLSQFPAGQSIGVLSFSLGGRIVTGAMHYLAGGSWLGKSLDAGDRAAVRSVCVAPAFDHDWLGQGRAFGQAMQATDRLRVFYNTSDSVLRRYDKLDRCGTAEALGYTGICTSPATFANRYCESDSARYVGKSHDLKDYLKHGSLVAEMRRYLFWQNLEG